MDSTQINTIVTIISIILTVLAIFSGIAMRDYLFPRLWRKKYIKEHTPTPHFEIEMNSRLGGSGIYVQPKIEMEDKDKKKVVKLLRDYFFDEVFVEGTKNGERVFCILGDTGMGKTAALVNFYVDYIKNYRKGNIPYDIWLYSLVNQNVFEKINHIENKGNSILLLDAVDENTDAQDDSRYDQFVEDLEQTYQDFAFVVTTCRPQFFGDESEVFDKTRVKRNGFFLKSKQLHLAPFDDEQVREYLYNLYYHEPNKTLKEEAERIMKKCPQIAQRPLVLSFITDLVNEKGRNYENTLDIYDNIVESLIRREVRKTTPDDDDATMRQWIEVLSEVAGFMYKNKKLKITLTEYETILSEHNLKVPQEVVDKKTFRQRSLLTRTVEGFHFSHKSFYEYFMAYRFFFNYGEVESLLDMDFTLQLFDELYLAYDSGKGNEHFGIDAVPTDEVAHCLYHIGNGLRQINRFSKAEEKYEEALEKYRQLEAITPEAYLPYVATTLNNLGMLHDDTGKHDKAEEEFGEALKTYRTLASSSPEAYQPYEAMTLNNLAILHRNTGKHEKAEEEFGEALETYRVLASSSLEAYQPFVAMTLNNLGALHRDTGKHEKAEEEHGKALETYRALASSSLEAYQPFVAMTLTNLGTLHSDTGKHDKAEKEFEEALKIYRTLASSSPEAYQPDVAGTLNNLAILHSATGKQDKAEKEYEEALKIRRQLASSSPEAYLPDVAETLNNLGNLHCDTGEHDKAEEEFEEALKIRRALVSSSPEAYLPYVAMTLNNLAILHRNTGKHEKAEEEYMEALKIRRQLASSSPEAYLPDVAETLNNLGNLHSDTVKHEKAEEEYEEALEIRRELASSSPDAYLPYVARTLFNIALLRIEQDNLDDAEKMAQESLGKFEIMAKLSPAAFAPYVEKAKELLEWIRGHK